MNALEREIAKELNSHGRDRFSESLAFKVGANFILEKNLPVLFAKWLDLDGYYSIDLFSENGFLDYDKIYDYWLNNVYGNEQRVNKKK